MSGQTKDPASGRKIPRGFRYGEVARRGRPVHGPLDAFSIRHPAMPLSRRAKIFSPFDALRGFSEAIAAKKMPYGYEAANEVSTGQSEVSTGRYEMCTRFFIDISDKELQEIVAAAENSALAEKFMRAGDPMTRSGEIYPTNVVPVIATAKAGGRAVFPMKWGFRISGMRGDSISTILNARSETAAQKPSFRDAWRQHRCVIPASYYFEWEHFTSPDGKKKTGRKYAIQPTGSTVTWLGGLYRMEEGFPRFVVLTRPPAENIAFIHDRMPVILPAQQIGAWIDPAADPDQICGSALEDMIYEAADQ